MKKVVATRVEKLTPEKENRQLRTPTFELMQQDLAAERKAHESRKERAQQFVDELKVLVSDEDPEISGPIVDALCWDVLPTVLEKEFGVSFTLEELCQAELTLREVEEERKRLKAKETELDGDAKKVQDERERLRMDSDKGPLFRRVESLEAQNGVLKSRLSEARLLYDNYGIVFSGFLDAIKQSHECFAHFLNGMESHPEANAWFIRGDWRRSKQKFLET